MNCLDRKRTRDRAEETETALFEQRYVPRTLHKQILDREGTSASLTGYRNKRETEKVLLIYKQETETGKRQKVL